MNDNNSLVLPFKTAKLNNKNNNLKEEWYLEFWAWSKSENKLKRKRLTAINRFKSIEERNNYAYHAIKEINRMLEAGYHFDNLKLEKQKAVEEIKQIKEHINIIEYLKKALENNRNKYNGRTYFDKKYEVKKFTEWIKSKRLGSLSFQELEKKHCVEYQNYLVNKGYAGKTVNCHISAIKTLYNEAINQEIVIKNPFQGIKKIKEVKTSRNIAYTDLQIKQLKDLLQDDYPELWLFCMMMFYCFLRPAEIIQLKLKDIDFINRKINVNAIVSKNKKSSKVDMPEPLIELLRKYLNSTKIKDYYLFTADNQPGFAMLGRNTMREKYNKIVKELNFDKDYTLYSWKHTGVIKAYKAGIDIKALQIQGRWHSIDMMDNYLKSLGLIENTAFTSVMNGIEL